MLPNYCHLEKIIARGKLTYEKEIVETLPFARLCELRIAVETSYLLSSVRMPQPHETVNIKAKQKIISLQTVRFTLCV